MVKNITISVLVLVIVGLLGYVIVKNTTNTTVVPPILSDDQPATVPPSIPATPTIQQYSDTVFGFSFSYPQSFIINTDTSGKVSIIPQALGLSGNPMTTIVKSTGSADDSTGKWGTWVISYANGGWVGKSEVEHQDGTSSLETGTAVPIAYTDSGLPIFKGGILSHDWGAYDYIVALSHTKFLKISGSDNTTGGPYNAATDFTLTIAKSVTAI